MNSTSTPLAMVLSLGSKVSYNGREYYCFDLCDAHKDRNGFYLSFALSADPRLVVRSPETLREIADDIHKIFVSSIGIDCEPNSIGSQLIVKFYQANPQTKAIAFYQRILQGDGTYALIPSGCVHADGFHPQICYNSHLEMAWEPVSILGEMRFFALLPVNTVDALIILEKVNPDPVVKKNNKQKPSSSFVAPSLTTSTHAPAPQIQTPMYPFGFSSLQPQQQPQQQQFVHQPQQFGISLPQIPAFVHQPQFVPQQQQFVPQQQQFVPQQQQFMPQQQFVPQQPFVPQQQQFMPQQQFVPQQQLQQPMWGWSQPQQQPCQPQSLWSWSMSQQSQPQTCQKSGARITVLDENIDVRHIDGDKITGLKTENDVMFTTPGKKCEVGKRCGEPIRSDDVQYAHFLDAINGYLACKKIRDNLEYTDVSRDTHTSSMDNYLIAVKELMKEHGFKLPKGCEST
jgi:hypothetical protein